MTRGKATNYLKNQVNNIYDQNEISEKINLLDNKNTKLSGFRR